MLWATRAGSRTKRPSPCSSATCESRGRSWPVASALGRCSLAPVVCPTRIRSSPGFTGRPGAQRRPMRRGAPSGSCQPTCFPRDPGRRATRVRRSDRRARPARTASVRSRSSPRCARRGLERSGSRQQRSPAWRRRPGGSQSGPIRRVRRAVGRARSRLGRLQRRLTVGTRCRLRPRRRRLPAPIWRRVAPAGLLCRTDRGDAVPRGRDATGDLGMTAGWVADAEARV